MRSLKLIAFIAFTIVPLAAQQPAFRFERPIATDAAGPHRLPLDVPVLAGAAPFTTLEPVESHEGRRWRAYTGASDLRLFDASNRELPYLFIYPQESGAQFRPGKTLPIAATEKTSGFEADLGAAYVVDAIQIAGLPAPFLKRLVLEGSGDRERWTLLAGEGTVFDLPQEQLRQYGVPFVAGSYRYLRVTWDDTNSGRVPSPAFVMARLAPSEAAHAKPLTTSVVAERRAGEPGRSYYRVRLPGARVPVVAVRLEVSGGHVFRKATVVESSVSNGRIIPRTIGRATLSRVVRDGMTAEDLRIPITAPREPVVEVVVEDGNNPPLTLDRVVIEFAELPWIYFESPGGSLTARYGAPSLQAPRYDLEAARAGIDIDTVPQARWADARALAQAAPAPTPPAAGTPAVGGIVDVRAFRYKRALPSAPAGLVVLPLDAAVLAHSRGPSASFGDVRIVDGDKQIPYLVERVEAPMTIDLPLRAAQPKARELTSAPGGRKSVYAVELPYAPLPGARIAIETSARTFSRTVSVGIDRPADRNHRDPWLQLVNSESWAHAYPDQPAPTLSLSVDAVEERELLIVVDEGDNAPLPITRATLLLPSYRVRFYHPGRPLTLMYDRTFTASPSYDLELLAPQLMGAEATEITAAPEAEARNAVAALVSPTVFWAGLGAAVLILGGLIVKLMRSPQPGA